MNILFVVSHRSDWSLDITGVDVVPAQMYLGDPAYRNLASTRVFNLCNSYDYQSTGYYVSLVAQARGHHPLPRQRDNGPPQVIACTACNRSCRRLPARTSRPSAGAECATTVGRDPVRRQRKRYPVQPGGPAKVPRCRGITWHAR